MKKKQVAAICMATLIATAALAPGTTVWAGLEEAGTVVDGSELTLFDFVEDEQVVLTRGNHLAHGSVAIDNQGNRVVGLSGITNCHVDCDTLVCNLYLEQKDSEGYWNNYGIWKYTKNDHHYLLASTTKRVAADHWYRVKGSHIAILNNEIESCVTITDGIYID